MKPQSIRPLSRLFVAIASVSALGSPAHAASTWSGSAASTDWATAADWGGTAPVTGGSLTFGAANASTSTTLTNTLTSSSFNVNGITFSAGAPAYTMTGNTFNLTAGITNNSGVLQTFSETGGLTATSSMTYTVTPTSGITLSTGLTDNGGALTTTVNGAGGTLTLGSLALTGANSTAAVIDFINGSGNVNITGPVTNGTMAGSSLNYTGTGTLTLSGASTNTGSTIISSGTLAIGASSTPTSGAVTSGPLGAGYLVLNTGTVVAVNGAQTVANNIAVDNDGAGTIAGSNALTFNGLLSLAGTNAPNSGQHWTTIVVNNTALTSFSGGIDMHGQKLFFGGSGTININSAIVDSTPTAPNFTYLGTGSLVLSGANSYGAQTQVYQGTVVAGTNSLQGGTGVTGAFGNSTTAIALGDSTSVFGNSATLGNGVPLSGAAAIVTNGAFTIGRNIAETSAWINSSLSIGGVQTTGTSTYTGNIALAANSTGTSTTTLTSASGGEVDFTTGVISGAQNIAISGGGKVVLTGANTFGGSNNSVTITGGSTLNLGAATNTNSLGSGSNTLIFNNGIFQYSAGTPFDLTATRSITLAGGGGTIDTNGNSVTFNNAISGAGGLTLSDSASTTGTLTLAATNAYTGGTTVNKGTVVVTGTLGGTSGNLAVNTGGNLDLSGTNQTVGNLSGTGGTISDNATGTVSTLTVGNGTASTSSSTYSGVIQDHSSSTGGQVAVTKTGAGTITLNGANTYTGATSVTNGTLAMGPAGSLGGTAVAISGTGNLQVGSLNSAAVTTIGLGSSTSVAINSGGSLTFANGVAGASSTTVDNLAINNTTSGSAALVLGGGGSINIGVGGAGGSDEIVLTGASGLLASLTGSTTINLNVLTALNGTSQELIAWGALPTGDGNFQLGTINGLGANGYTLSLTETSAGLFLTESAVSNAYWKGSLGSNWATGLPGGNSNFATDAAGTTNRTAALDAFTTVTFAATGASASSYANSTLGGNQTINSLVLSVSGVGIDITNPAVNTLTLAAAGTAITVGGNLGTENIGSNVAMTNSETWQINGGSTLAVSGNISGANSTLTKAGTGTLVLSGTNSYSGATAIGAGVVSVQSADALDGTSSITVSNGASLQLATTGTTTTTTAVPLTLNGSGISNSGALDNVSGDNTYTGNITLNSDSTIRAETGSSLSLTGATISNPSNSTLTLTGGGTGDLVGVLSSGALVKNGSGIWGIEGENSYTGGTTINGGTLQLGATSLSSTSLDFLGSETGALTVNTGGTLDLNGWNLSVGNLNGTGGTIENNFTGFGSILTLNTQTASSYAGSITDGTGGISVIKTGAATQTLTGTNSYTGTTSIEAGALNIASNGALGTATSSTSSVIVSSGAALQLSGGITTTAAAPLTLSGTGIGGTTSTGALENVNGNNTFTGSITLNGDASIGSDSGTLTLAATATIGGSGNLTLVGSGNGVIAGSITSGIESLTLNSSGTYTSTSNTTGTWTLSGVNSYSGPTTVANGTLAYTSGVSLPSGSTLDLGTTASTGLSELDYTGAGETIANAINLNGTAVLGNTGTGAVNYTTAPTVNAGTSTLVLGNPTDTIGGSIGNLSGSLNVTKTGTINNRWILTGTNNYTGTTTVNGGVLQVASGSTFANLNLNGTVSNAVLQTSGTLNLTTTGVGTNFNLGPNAGFSAIGGTLTVTLNGGAELFWGSNGFSGNGGAVVDFGSATSDSQVIFTNNINLNTTDGFNQSVYVAKGVGGDSTVLSGVISGGTTMASVGPPAVGGSASGFNKAGAGTLILTNANNSYSGYTSIESGTLVAEASSSITATPTAGVAGYTATGVFGSGYGFYGAAAATAGYSTINVGFTQGGGTTLNGVSNPTLMIGSQTVGGSNSIANPVAIDWNNGSGQVFGIGGYSDANGTFSGLITLNGSNATSGNTFAVTQVATTGTDALNITGGITATNGGNINFANVGAVNVTTTAISNGGATPVSVTQTGSGTTTFATANTYTGGTTVTAGTFVVTNTMGSATGSGAVAVTGNTSVLKGPGIIAGAVTLSNGANLFSGSTAAGTGIGSGMTLTSSLAVNGASLSFQLNNGTNTATYANPNETTSFLNLGSTGTISFTGSDAINLVDLTNGGLTLRGNAPYLLISGSSDSVFSGLVTEDANGVLSLDGNGTVLGVYNGTGDLTNYTAITINQLGANGVTPLGSNSYSSAALYLNNDDLEINSGLAATPEPGTWALLLGSLALVVLIQRRRSAQR